MDAMTAAEFWSLVSSIVSAILGVGAIAFSLYFFVAGKRVEKEVSKSLVKIQTQAEMLQKLSGKQLDRLTRFVTTERPDPTAEVTRLLLSYTELTKPLSATLPSAPAGADATELRAELHTCYIAMYYYAAISNFWSQLLLPAVAEFDEKNEFHQLTRRVVDSTAVDFNYMASILGSCDAAELSASPLAHLLTEAKEQWREHVKAAADVFIARDKEEE